MISVVRILFLGAAILLMPMADAAEPSPERPSPPAGSGKKFRRRPPKVFFAKLTEAERAEIDRLAREGKKDELRNTMKKLMFKYRPEEMKLLDALSERYLKSSDEKERASIRQEMEKLSRILFRKRQDFTRNNIAEAEKQLQRAQQDLERLKNHYRCNEENMEKIIADHVERMCLPPEKRWKPNHQPPYHTSRSIRGPLPQGASAGKRP